MRYTEIETIIRQFVEFVRLYYPEVNFATSKMFQAIDPFMEDLYELGIDGPITVDKSELDVLFKDLNRPWSE